MQSQVETTEAIQQLVTTEKKPKITKFMKGFIERLSQGGQQMDFSVKIGEDGKTEFVNSTTQFAWFNYSLGYRAAHKYQPGIMFVGKVTEDGIQFAKKPRAYWSMGAAMKGVEYATKKWGGRYTVFSIPTMVYSAIKEQYKDNPNVEFKNDEISSLPFFIKG